MKLLLDVNVILDVILEREPWADEAAQLLAAVERKEVQAFVAAHTITTAYYVISKNRDKQTAATAISDLLRLLEVVPLETPDFNQALVLGLSDYEDAVQAASAMKIGADYLVTRNEKDFRGTPTPTLPPGAVLSQL